MRGGDKGESQNDGERERKRQRDRETEKRDGTDLRRGGVARREQLQENADNPPALGHRLPIALRLDLLPETDATELVGSAGTVFLSPGCRQFLYLAFYLRTR